MRYLVQRPLRGLGDVMDTLAGWICTGKTREYQKKLNDMMAQDTETIRRIDFALDIPGGDNNRLRGLRQEAVERRENAKRWRDWLYKAQAAAADAGVASCEELLNGGAS